MNTKNFRTSAFAVVLNMLLALGADAGFIETTRVSVVSVRPGGTDSDGAARVQRYGVTRADHERIMQSVAGIAQSIPVRESTASFSVPGRGVKDVRLVGSSELFLALDACQLEAGRNLNREDLLSSSNVVVLGPVLKMQLFPEQNAIGKAVRINQRDYEVVGVMSRETVPAAMADRALIPISTMRSRIGDIVLSMAGGTFGAEQYELSRLELILKQRDQRFTVRDAVKEILAGSHEGRRDYRLLISKARFVQGPPAKSTQQKKSVLETGTIEPAVESGIRSEVEGESRIKLIAAEGSRVKQGDLVLELENPELLERHVRLQAEVEQLKATESQVAASVAQAAKQRTEIAEVAELKIKLATAAREAYFGTNGQFNRELAALKRSLNLAQRAVRVAEESLKDAKASDGPKEQRAQLELQVQRATAEVANTEDAIRMHEGPQRTEKQLRFALGLAEATASANTAKAKANATAADARRALVASRAELRVSEARLDALEKQLRALKVLAPHSGTVLYAAQTSTRGAQPIAAPGRIGS